MVAISTNSREKRKKAFGFVTLIDCKLVIIANHGSMFDGEGGGGRGEGGVGSEW